MFRRCIAAMLFAVGLLVGCTKEIPPPIQSKTVVQVTPAAPAVGDYAVARKAFQTKLVRNGPSPQRSSLVRVPTGVEEIEYRSGDLPLKAWFARGGGTEKRTPAVLFLHGGWAFGEDDWEMTKPFRDAGFAVMTPILRGENGQPGAFSMFYDEVDDVIAAADKLAAQPKVDPSRLFLAGHSAGGTLTLLTALACPRFKAAAAFSGAANMQQFLASGWSRQAPFDPSLPKEVEMRSAAVYAESFKCPTKIFFGSREFGFADECRTTAQTAQGKGLNVEAVMVEGDHFSAVPEETRQAIAFFRSLDSKPAAQKPEK